MQSSLFATEQLTRFLEFAIVNLTAYMKYIIALVAIIILIPLFNQLSDLHKDIIGDILIVWTVVNVVRKVHCYIFVLQTVLFIAILESPT